jgi:hypothetical protein
MLKDGLIILTTDNALDSSRWSILLTNASVEDISELGLSVSDIAQIALWSK